MQTILDTGEAAIRLKAKVKKQSLSQIKGKDPEWNFYGATTMNLSLWNGSGVEVELSDKDIGKLQSDLEKIINFIASTKQQMENESKKGIEE